ncbi:MAG TPA: shikimate kinase [bacterium]|nr:shikimate kinase [bacterium]
MYKQLFAVAGNPVLHSSSPAMFNDLFNRHGINAVYLRILAKTADEVLYTAEKIGMSGINVTAPFKEKMVELMDEIDESAGNIGAVNTILLKNGQRLGFNTDWLGVIDSFRQSGIDVSGKKVLVAGAGGAAKAAVYAMIKEKAVVTIVNRTGKKGIELAERFGVKFVRLNQLPELMDNFDIIISTVSGGINIFPENSFKPEHIVFDADYHNFTVGASAQKQGAKVIHGSLWLINQAKRSLRLFIKTDFDDLKLPEPFKMKDNIAFAGFMGSGKTSTARELAKMLDRPLFDTDEFIEQNELMTISEIFAKKGESYFRELEDKAVVISCSLKDNIISFGGGAALSEKNYRAIRSNCLTIWLFANAEETLKRIGSYLLKRPLLYNCDDPLEKTDELLKRRIPYYAECADLIINSENMHPFEIAEIIVGEINKTFRN